MTNAPGDAANALAESRQWLARIGALAKRLREQSGNGDQVEIRDILAELHKQVRIPEERLHIRVTI